MKLRIDGSLKVAHKVLALTNVPKQTAERVSISGYENGREHGLCARKFLETVTVCWAENRSSDNIVVYVSEPNEAFEEGTNVPTQRAYRAAKYFQWDDMAGAARFISNVLKNSI